MCLTIFCMFLGYAQLILMNLCKIMHTCTCPHRSASLHYRLGPRTCHSWSQCWCCCGYVYHHLPDVLLCWRSCWLPSSPTAMWEEEGRTVNSHTVLLLPQKTPSLHQCMMRWEQASWSWKRMFHTVQWTHWRWKEIPHMVLCDTS